MNCFANPIPPDLIKVTKEFNPKCVEYVRYNGEMYCTIKATDNAPLDPQLLTVEKQKIQFDDRPWKLAWGKQDGANYTLEYIPLGADINQWQELITSQFFSGLDVSALEFSDKLIQQLQQMGLVIETNYLDKQPNEVILEFKVSNPINLRQNELQKIVKRPEGIYVLHYAIKKVDMGAEERDKWLMLLKKSGFDGFPHPSLRDTFSQTGEGNSKSLLHRVEKVARSAG